MTKNQKTFGVRQWCNLISQACNIYLSVLGENMSEIIGSWIVVGRKKRTIAYADELVTSEHALKEMIKNSKSI